MGVVPAAGAVRVLEVFLGVKDTGLTAGLQRANRKVGLFTGTLGKATKSVRTFQTQAAFAAFAVAEAVGVTTRQFMEFERQVTLAAFASGRGMKAFKEMREESNRLSKAYALNATEAARVVREVQQLDSKLTKETAQALADAGSQFALATGNEIEAARSLTTVFRLLKSTVPTHEFQEAAKSAERVASAMLIAGDDSAAGSAQVSRFIESMQSLGISINFTTGEIISMSGALASLRPQDSQTFTTALTRIFSSTFIDPRRRGGLLEVLDMTNSEFERLRTQDPDALLLRLGSQLQKGGDLAAKGRLLGFSNQRDIRLLATFIETMELYEETLAKVNDELYGSDETLLSERTQTLLSQLKGAWDGLTASLSRLADTIGASLNPVLNPLFNMLSGIADVLSENPLLTSVLTFGALGVAGKFMNTARLNIMAMTGGDRFFGAGGFFGLGGKGGGGAGGAAASRAVQKRTAQEVGESFAKGAARGGRGSATALAAASAFNVASLLPFGMTPSKIPAGARGLFGARVGNLTPRQRARLGMGAMANTRPGSSLLTGKNFLGGFATNALLAELGGGLPFIQRDGGLFKRRGPDSRTLRRRRSREIEGLVLAASGLAPAALGKVGAAADGLVPFGLTNVEMRALSKKGSRPATPRSRLLNNNISRLRDVVSGSPAGIGAHSATAARVLGGRSNPMGLVRSHRAAMMVPGMGLDPVSMMMLASMLPQGVMRSRNDSARNARRNNMFLRGINVSAFASAAESRRNLKLGTKTLARNRAASSALGVMGMSGLFDGPLVGKVGPARGGVDPMDMALLASMFPGVGVGRGKGRGIIGRIGSGIRGAGRFAAKGSFLTRIFSRGASARIGGQAISGVRALEGAQFGKGLRGRLATRNAATLTGRGSRQLIGRGSQALAKISGAGRAGLIGRIGTGITQFVGKQAAGAGLGGLAARGGLAAAGLATGPVGIIATTLSVLTPLFEKLGNTFERLGNQGGIMGAIFTRLATVFKILQTAGNLVNFVFRKIGDAIKGLFKIIEKIPIIGDLIEAGRKAGGKFNNALDSFNEKLSGKKDTGPGSVAPPMQITNNIAVGDEEAIARAMDDSIKTTTANLGTVTTKSPVRVT